MNLNKALPCDVCHVHRYGQENGKLKQYKKYQLVQNVHFNLQREKNMGKYVTYWSKTFHVEVVRDPVNSSLDSFYMPPKPVSQHIWGH